MFLLDPIETPRNIEVISRNNRTCLLSNGTIITIEAFVYLMVKQWHAHPNVNVDNIFLGAAKDLPISGPTEYRYIDLDKENKSDWVLSRETESEDFHCFELDGPESISFQIRTRNLILDFTDV